MIIFMKRYIKTPLFFLSIISAFTMYFLYENTNLSLNNSLNVGIYSVEDKRLEEKLINKNSYFKYKSYTDVDSIKKDINSGVLSYGFKIDFSEDKPFTLYGSDDKFSEIAKEDCYSTYFEILSYEYSKNLLNISDDEYKKNYDEELKRTFKFEYADDDNGKIFPIREVSAFLLLVLSMLSTYDYFRLNQKSEFFSTYAGRKNKYKFILSSILINSFIYYIMLSYCINIRAFYVFLYTVVLFYLNMIFVNMLKYKYYMIFMPLYIIMCFISIFMSNMDKLDKISLFFVNNWLIKFEYVGDSYFPLIILMNILVWIFTISNKNRFHLE